MIVETRKLKDNKMQTSTDIKEKTNKKMMILSFIGIIIVVLGHTGDQLKLASDLFSYYSFHMALFIFISGYFYKPEYENNLWGRKGYIFKKVKRLVVPYFIWNLIYGIILMVLKKFNVVSFGEPINFSTLFIKPWTTGHQYILNLASWFLLALFLVNIVYILIRKLSSKIKLWNDYVAIFIFLVVSVLSIYISKKGINQNFIPLLRTCFFIFFYQLGYMYKTKIEGKIKINTVLYFMILIIIELIFWKLEGKLSYVAAFMKFECKFLLTPIIVSITGILFWCKVSEILVPSLGNSKIVNYISNNTYDIMLHHLFCMFLINFVVWKMADILNLSGFNVDRFRTTIYYCYTAGVMKSQIIYSILVIAMPLSARWIYDKITNRLINFKNNIKIIKNIGGGNIK